MVFSIKSYAEIAVVFNCRSYNCSSKDRKKLHAKHSAKYNNTFANSRVISWQILQHRHSLNLYYS